MLKAFVLILCGGILCPAAVSAQERDPDRSRTPDWVYIASATAITIAGALWYHRTFVKSNHAHAEKALKEKSQIEITYLATAKEKKALQKLKTAEEIHAFMQSFWQSRDPNLETPENEFEEEYLRRFDEANAQFADHRAGWETDRGRVHLLYGLPDEIRRELGST